MISWCLIPDDRFRAVRSAALQRLRHALPSVPLADAAAFNIGARYATAGRSASRTGPRSSIRCRGSKRNQLRLAARDVQPARQYAAAHGIARGDRVAILLPQMPEVAAIHIAIYKLGAIALPLAILFGVDAISYRLQDAGARAVITNAQGLAKMARMRRACRIWNWCCRSTGRRRRAGLPRRRSRAPRTVHAGGHSRRRSGDDDLHLRHHRPAEGRARAASRAARPSARRRDSCTNFSAGGRPDVDAGGLGLGRRIAQRSAAGPLLRRAGGGAKIRQVRSGRGFRADGADRRAQRFHSADGAAHAARGAKSARPSCDLRCARVGSGGESLGAETYEWGKSALGLTINEFYGQTECNMMLVVLRRDRRVASPARSASRCPAIAVAVIRDDGSVCAAGEIGPDRGASGPIR